MRNLQQQTKKVFFFKDKLHKDTANGKEKSK